jgi:DNA-binding winged helix-turn-helix (wHTH) protein
MDALAKISTFVFEGFRLDQQGLFRRDQNGVFIPIPIGSRALDVLVVLVGRAGDLVSRDQIIAAAWPATVVGDNNLNMQIATLRRVLDEGRAAGSCIQTAPGRGYRFAPRRRPNYQLRRRILMSPSPRSRQPAIARRAAGQACRVD